MDASDAADVRSKSPGTEMIAPGAAPREIKVFGNCRAKKRKIAQGYKLWYIFRPSNENFPGSKEMTPWRWM